jgi:hypothetical protein
MGDVRGKRKGQVFLYHLGWIDLVLALSKQLNAIKRGAELLY